MDEIPSLAELLALDARENDEVNKLWRQNMPGVAESLASLRPSMLITNAYSTRMARASTQAAEELGISRASFMRRAILDILIRRYPDEFDASELLLPKDLGKLPVDRRGRRDGRRRSR